MNLAQLYDRLGLSPLDRYTIEDLNEFCAVDGVSGPDEALCTVLAFLFQALENGSLCMEIEPNAAFKCSDGFSDQEYLVQKLFYEWLEKGKTGRYCSILGTGDQFTPLVLRETDDQRSLLYFYRYYQAERKFEKALKGRFLLRPEEEKVCLEIAKEIQDRYKECHLQQQLAVYLALTENFLILTGGPGTGKTFTASLIVTQFLRKKPDAIIKLAAATGKAAKRLGEQMKNVLKNSTAVLEAETVHRLLGFFQENSKKRENKGYHQDNPIPCDLLIVDEVSMLDIHLFTALLEAVAPDTSLVLLGDRAQLPSVDAGAVLGDLIPEGYYPIYSERTEKLFKLDSCFTESKRSVPHSSLTDRVVLLSQQYRSEGKITRITEMIRNDQDVLDEIPVILPNVPLDTCNNGIYFIDDCDDPIKSLKKILYQYKESYFSSPEQIFSLEASKILTLNREGMYGALGVNDFLESIYSQKRLAVGTPIMITANHYHLNLFNGDSGVIVFEDSILKGEFSAGGTEEKIRIPLHFLPAFETAFAITVHKSQGSEYEDVVLILPPDEANPLLTKEIVYTALTRAKKRVFIFGKKTLLMKALKTKIIRYSGITL